MSNSDEDLLAYAAEQHRVLVTANIVDFAAIATDWRACGRVHHGIVYIAYRTFGQDRSFIGALVDALAALYQSKTLPPPGTQGPGKVVADVTGVTGWRRRVEPEEQRGPGRTW